MWEWGREEGLLLKKVRFFSLNVRERKGCSFSSFLCSLCLEEGGVRGGEGDFEEEGGRRERGGRGAEEGVEAAWSRVKEEGEEALE